MSKEENYPAMPGLGGRVKAFGEALCAGESTIFELMDMADKTGLRPPSSLMGSMVLSPMEYCEGRPDPVDLDALYVVFVQGLPGHGLGRVVRGRDANWNSREVVGFMRLPVLMTDADIGAFHRDGSFPGVVG